MSSTTVCNPTGFTAVFSPGAYEITASAINIQNITTGAKFIGVYSQNQFNVPTSGGPSTPVTLQVINPANNQVVDTLTDIITFSLGKINQCVTTSFENNIEYVTTTYYSQLTGYSQYFGPISTTVIVNPESWTFAIFENSINTAFQTTLNGETYSITVNGLYIEN